MRHTEPGTHTPGAEDALMPGRGVCWDPHGCGRAVMGSTGRNSHLYVLN